MGNENSTSLATIDPQQLKKQFHSHLGPTTLLQHNNNLCQLKTFAFADNFLMQDIHRKLKSRISKSNTSVLNIYQIGKRERKDLCAHNYQLLVYLQQFDESLRQKIGQRLLMRKNYSEDELFVFLGRVVDALLYIQDNGLKNIQLDCQSIIFCGETVKVLDAGLAVSKSYTDLLGNLEKGEKYQGSLYLAPELLKELQELNYDPYISPKADIFSLGMIIMEMVGLQSMMGYYDYQKVSIDYDSLIHRLSRINHSLPLKTLIAEMLEYDPEERIGLVSLKEKIQRLRVPPEQGMSRSKSGKMLQNILSNSRRSGSGCRATERSSSMQRGQSSQKKNQGKIQLRCSNQKRQSRLRTETEPSSVPASIPLTERNDNNIVVNPNDLRNLVKNKLNKGKQSKKSQKQTRPLPQPKTMLQTRNMFQQSQSNPFECSIASQKLGISTNSNKQNVKGVRSTLNKLVEESGMKKLLKLEQLSTSNFRKSQESIKNTSRFGNFEHSGGQQPTQTKSKMADIYIKDQQNPHQRISTVVYSQHREQVVKVTPQRTLQKVMTFNKQLLLNARSVQNSIQHLSRVFQTSPSQLALSPLESAESQYKNINIKDVPVVISQQKSITDLTPPNNFGKLQRKLNLIDIDSVRQGQSINTSLNNISNVIQTYKPHEEDYSSVKQQPIFEDFSAPFKKGRNKKPQLVIQLDNDFTEQPSNQRSKSENNQKNNQSVQLISNFTSISPQKCQRQDSINQIMEMGQVSPELECSQRIKFPNGEEYQGDLLGDIPHGNGILYLNGKTYYSGSFNLGKFHGYGTLHNLKFNSQPADHTNIDLNKNNWSRFQGQFQNGNMTGFGTIFFCGGKFSGCLKKGIIEGYGCFYGSNGELISGLWADNRYRKV